MLSLTALVISGITSIFLIFVLKLTTKTKGNLPPGPWGFPIIGHVPFFGKNPARTFMKWKKQYGSMFLVKFGSIPTIILNDAKVIREAFSMEEFSGRPLLPIFVAMTGGKGLGFVDGPEQVEQRKFVLKTLKEHSFSTNELDLRLREEVPKLIKNVKSRIRQTPGQAMEINKIFQHCINNVIWDSMMGRRFDEGDKTLSHLMEMIEKAIHTNGSIFSKLFWFFPWVSRFGNWVGYNPPLKSFITIYNFMRKTLKEMEPLHIQGQPKNFTDAYFDKVADTTDGNSSFHVSKKYQPMSTTDIFIAGSDAANVTMDWLLIYMAQEPQVQIQLQEEIDSVIGQSDPSLSDRTKMLFTEAVLHELLRMSTIAPFAIFHRTIQDVHFQGYDIPKNTMVIANLFGVNHDPDIWEEPDRFNPQRFLDTKNGKINKLTSDLLAFSSGKRSCPGESFARNELFMLITSFFQHFSVSLTDPPSSLDINFGITHSPCTFKLNVKER